VENVSEIEKIKKRCEEAIEKSKEIIREAFNRFKPSELGITWTGGKDSTTNLWIIHQVCLEDNIKIPKVMTIDDGDTFEEIRDFINKWKKKWNLDHEWWANEDVLKAANYKLGNIVRVKDLNERNQAELKRIGFEGSDFPFEPESRVCTHLMKTVVFNQFIEKYNLKGIFMALRWDEHPARRNEQYFSKKEGGYLVPEHWRIHPILHFTERDIWNTIRLYNIPFCVLYEQGYRSLGSKTTSKKLAGIPAWEQDLENTDERGGRWKEKEKDMEILRRLGYM